ncbi:MAG: phosphate uptake regulator PhoU [Candidatus Bathyarchaeota archaeon]|nr:MAG: phosphate uptake regulator PhoU [Candidatus Bathyarchaeota archaeon]
MDLRKVQRTSGGTFFVCVPKEWAERSGLQRSSVVAISEMADGRLCINPKYYVAQIPRVAIIRPSPFLDREIVGKYLLGCDVIRVEGKARINSVNRDCVKQVSSRLVGLEIVEEDYSKIVMRCLLEPSTFPPRKILRREYSIASGMHRDAVTALVEGDEHLAENVIARDNEVNRLYFLLVRCLRTVVQDPSLSEKLEVLPIDCLDYRLTASLVESIGDYSVQIAGKATRLKGTKLPENLLQLVLHFHRQVYNSHEDALKALFSRDVELAQSVGDKQDKISSMFGEVESTAGGLPVDVAARALAVASLIGRIYDNGVDIADLVMPKSV